MAKLKFRKPDGTFASVPIVRVQSDYEEGYDAGKQAQYDEFWDAFQKKGAAANYNSRFYSWSTGWEAIDAIYKPKYDFIHATDASNVFRESHIKDIIKDNYFDYKTSPTTLAYTFYYATRLENARTLHVREDTKYTSAFNGCSKLKEVRFEGTIGQNGLSFADCPKLSKESIRNIIEHLDEYVMGVTVTFNCESVDIGFETESGAYDGSNSDEWYDLDGAKPNWTIILS